MNVAPKNYLEGGSPADGFHQANVERAEVHQRESGQEEVGDQQGDRVQLSCKRQISILGLKLLEEVAKVPTNQNEDQSQDESKCVAEIRFVALAVTFAEDVHEPVGINFVGSDDLHQFGTRNITGQGGAERSSEASGVVERTESGY